MMKRVINWMTSVLNKRDELAHLPVVTTVAEPILSFVSAVKASPERFTFTGIVNTLGGDERYVRKFQDESYGHYWDAYRFTDIKLGKVYTLRVFNVKAYLGDNMRHNDKNFGGSTTQPNYLQCSDNRLSFITQLEWLFIEEQLYLPYLERLQVIKDKKVLRKTLNNERKYKVEKVQRELVSKRQREEYCNLYCE
jgi:hypothetical protein